MTRRIDVKKIRQSLGMTQDQFAVRFGLNLGTVRDWEQGRFAPTGPARVLLIVIEQQPNVVLRALEAA